MVQEIVRSFLSSAHVRYLIADGAVENLHQVSFLPSGFLALLSFRMKIYGFSYMQLLTLINQKCFDCILKKYFAFKLQIVITEYSHTPVYRLCQLAVSFNLPLTVSPDLPSPPIYCLPRFTVSPDLPCILPFPKIHGKSEHDCSLSSSNCRGYSR